MMLSKKNSETLENFSEKLEVEGRSLWQDARPVTISALTLPGAICWCALPSAGVSH